MSDKRTESRKAAASRANGAKSRGPVSPEGKARSSQNAIRHGGYTDAILLGNEDPAGWENLFREFTARFNPIGLPETGLVEEMAAAHWRIRRYWFAESATLDMEMARQQPDLEKECEFISEPARLSLAIAHFTAQPDAQALQIYHRIESRLRRQYSRALSDLIKIQQLRLQAQPEALPPAPETKNDGTNPPPSQPPAPLPLAEVGQASGLSFAENVGTPELQTPTTVAPAVRPGTFSTPSHYPPSPNHSILKQK